MILQIYLAQELWPREGIERPAEEGLICCRKVVEKEVHKGDMQRVEQIALRREKRYHVIMPTQLFVAKKFAKERTAATQIDSAQTALLHHRLSRYCPQSHGLKKN